MTELAGPIRNVSEKGQQPAPGGQVNLGRRRASSGSTWARVWQRFFRHKPGVAGLVVMIVMLLGSLFAPVASLGKSPYQTNYSADAVDAPPSREHIMGTDHLGRDVWARLVYGSRISLSIGLVVVGLTTLLGAIVGGISGYFGGPVDTVIQRFTEAMMLFPTFLLIITVATYLKPSIFNVMVVLGVFGWPGTSRLVRGMFLYLRETDYVLAARALGVPWHRIIFGHILPGCMAPLMVSATFGLVGAIMTESTLSFLGLGVQEPAPSWGSTLQYAMKLPTLVPYPWRWVPAAVLISIAMLATNFMGDGLRDALDPRAIER